MRACSQPWSRGWAPSAAAACKAVRPAGRATSHRAASKWCCASRVLSCSGRVAIRRSHSSILVHVQMSSSLKADDDSPYRNHT